MRKPLFRMCNQVGLKPAFSVTEASRNLEISGIATIGVILYKHRAPKALIRLSGCAGWSEPVFFAYVIRQVFSQCGSFRKWTGNQNQNQNCYWWHVQMTIIHQDLWWGKLVPSPYKRSELSNRVFCSFSSRKESICKWIPISNSLGKEAALVNVSISKGGLKCQRVVISDMPNRGDKVIRRYTGCTLQDVKMWIMDMWADLCLCSVRIWHKQV